MHSLSTVKSWLTVCTLDDIAPNTGVCALVEGQQVAIFRVGEDELYAIDNFDPFSNAYVLARGIVGDRGGIPKVASPIYKQNFNLRTGECFDDPSVTVKTFAVQRVDHQVQIGCHE
ncbi:MAG: nitrite reductase small subunit NirD [Leptolyngbya sp. Prado105]|jgi:nitrite reductase (NADH) small subunit|nr:nitrite reductase small subunit NirD [Leptolyngbya sp. Prado105]